jgi:hypothetical protein
MMILLRALFPHSWASPGCRSVYGGTAAHPPPPARPQDGSGFLDRDEVRTVVEMFMGQMSDTDLDEAMAALDESGDGQVDFPEFRKYWFENLGTGGYAWPACSLSAAAWGCPPVWWCQWGGAINC